MLVFRLFPWRSPGSRSFQSPICRQSQSHHIRQSAANDQKKATFEGRGAIALDRKVANPGEQIARHGHRVEKGWIAAGQPNDTTKDD